MGGNFYEDSEANQALARLRNPNILGSALFAAVLGITAATTASASPAAETYSPQASAEVTASPERGAQLQRAATVELRYMDSGEAANMPTGTLANDSLTYQHCTAAHIGNGWFITAAHCFSPAFGTDEKGATNSMRDAVYDIMQGTPLARFSAWAGPNFEQLRLAGDARGVVLDGNPTHSDTALLYAPDSKAMPSLTLAERPPSYSSKYFIAGYPGLANSTQVQVPMRYLGEVQDTEFANTHRTNRLGSYYVFGVPASLGNPTDICRSGMSGSTIVDVNGAAYGTVTFLGKRGNTLWNAIQGRYNAPLDDAVVCAATKIDIAMIRNYQAKLGVPAPAAAPIVK